MNRQVKLRVFGWAIALMVNPVFAFEVTTHAVLTKQAWDRFIASDPGMLDRLGLQQNLNDAFNTSGYYDYRPNYGEVPFKRYGLDFEFKIIRDRVGIIAIADGANEDVQMEHLNRAPTQVKHGDTCR